MGTESCTVLRLRLMRKPAMSLRDRSSSYKIDFVIVIKNFFIPEGHQNPISGSKVTAILRRGWILPIGGASAGEGLRLQPAQQACFNICDNKDLASLTLFVENGNVCLLQFLGTFNPKHYQIWF